MKVQYFNYQLLIFMHNVTQENDIDYFIMIKNGSRSKTISFRQWLNFLNYRSSSHI